MPHPLSPFPIVSTGDPEEAQSILSLELESCRIRKVLDPQGFRFEMNGVHLGRTMVGYNHFRTETTIDPGELHGTISLIMGIGQPAIFHVDGEPVACSEAGAVLAPPRRVVIHRPADSGIMIIKARFETIEEQLCKMLGRTLHQPLIFDRSVGLASGVGAQAQRLFGFLVEDLQQERSLLENRLLRAGIDEMLLNTLLALPSNYRDELEGGRRTNVAPAVVRLAEDFLEANAAEPITIADVLVQCGCSRSALYTAFRSFRGYSPMEFLSECRLSSARGALQDPSGSDTVTSIALSYGFAHLGRFSAVYLRRFGEKPSETLRRAQLEA